MENRPNNHPGDFDELNKRINELEKRMARLEEESLPPGGRGLIRYYKSQDIRDDTGPQPDKNQKESVESRVGEYGMAWLGNIVLLIGILFLSQLLQKNNQEMLSLVLGFAAVGGIYLGGYYTRSTFPYMSQLFTYNGHILLYITSMRIHLFPGSRITEHALPGYGIVLLVIGAFIYLAFRNRSQVMAILVWLMVVITAMMSNSTHLMLSLMLVITGSSILFTIRRDWWIGMIISIILVYFTFLIWIMGNAFVTGSFEIITDHQFGYIYLFFCALSYSLLAMFHKSDRVPENLLMAGIVLNGIGFSFILALAVLAFFPHNYYVYFGLIAAFSMGYSILLQSRGTWRTIAAMYAIYSFVALSIAIAGIYKFPLAYFLLSIQSLLVVSMALWFRSRFIVIMNTILFVGLLITYLATAHTLVPINFSFALVALLTARIMNWKKKRLEIRTELIRNIYLFIGAAMVLYSLQKVVPAQFVTLSWTLSAMLFFILSILIKNMKYRWLAIITMVITVFYLFIVDLQNISLGYRIIALLFISIISLGISIFYTRRQKNKHEDQN